MKKMLEEVSRNGIQHRGGVDGQVSAHFILVNRGMQDGRV